MNTIYTLCKTWSLQITYINDTCMIHRKSTNLKKKGNKKNKNKVREHWSMKIWRIKLGDFDFASNAVSICITSVVNDLWPLSMSLSLCRQSDRWVKKNQIKIKTKLGGNDKLWCYIHVQFSFIRWQCFFTNSYIFWPISYEYT